MKRKIICAAICFALLASGMVAAALVDDFESYATGQVNTVTGGKWWSSNPGWGLIETRAVRPGETSADNKQLVLINAVTARGDLGDQAVERGNAILFTHFRASNNQTNHSFGLTDLNEATEWGDFVIQIALVNGTIRVTDAGTTRTLASIGSGWSSHMYNLWVVIDHDEQTFQVYMNREATWDPEEVDEADRLTAGDIDTFGYRRIPTGPLNTFLGKGNNDQRIWLDNIYLKTSPIGANTPTPAKGATGVGVPYTTSEVEVTLNWKPGQDPNDPALPYPPIRSYYLYMSKDQNLISDPNLYYVDTIDAGDPISMDVSYGPIILNMDGSYLWRVDTGIDDDAGGVTGFDDPNTIRGPLWGFETLQSVPIITAQPADVLLDAVGQTAEFVVEVSSISPAMYQWYKASDFANPNSDEDTPVGPGGMALPDCPLSLSNVQLSDEGFYYCRTWNTGGVIYSNVVRLGVKQHLAHWTLDGLINNQYADETGNFHADPNNPAGVQFVDGIRGNAVAVDQSSFALAVSALDPSGYTNQMTISAWVRVTGDLPDSDGHGIVSKRLDGSSDQWRWSLYARGRGGFNARSVRLQTWNGGDAWSNPNSIPANEWTHVAAVVGTDRVGRVYVNGLQNGNTQGNWNWGPKADAPVTLGRWTPTTSLFPGEIDDVQIWNYGKDKYQIADLYHAETGISVCTDPLPAEIAVFDFNNDCKVDMLDFVEFTASWLDCGLYPDCL